MKKQSITQGKSKLDRDTDRDHIFQRAIKQFIENPGACAYPGNIILFDLIYGWGNEDWSAKDEYLSGCIEYALTAQGPILECGSGLSTILLGIIAAQQRQDYWVLEHSPKWTAKVQDYINKYQLASVILCTNPLKDYGSFYWYDTPLESMPDSFSLVICDGPPGRTKGGRCSLVPIMRGRLKPGCIILLDDAGRAQERLIAHRWQSELDASLEILGSDKPYIKLLLNS